MLIPLNLMLSGVRLYLPSNRIITPSVTKTKKSFLAVCVWRDGLPLVMSRRRSLSSESLLCARIGDGPLSGLGSSVKPCFSSLENNDPRLHRGLSAKASAYLRWLCSIVPCRQHPGLGGGAWGGRALRVGSGEKPPDARHTNRQTPDRWRMVYTPGRNALVICRWGFSSPITVHQIDTQHTQPIVWAITHMECSGIDRTKHSLATWLLEVAEHS